MNKTDPQVDYWRTSTNTLPSQSSIIVNSSHLELGGPFHRWRDDDEKSRTRRICCCFKSITGCFLTMLSVLIVLGVVVFFLFPRFPVIAVSPPYTNNAKQSFRYNVTNGNISALSYDVLVDFSVSSQNYWDYYAGEIVTIGHLLDSQETPITNSLAYGVLTNATFAAHATTNFTMPLTLYWVTIGEDVNSDPALLRIQACILKTPAETCKLSYYSKVTLPIISWTGFYFKPGGTFSFNIENLSASAQTSVKLVANSILNSFNPREFPL